MCSTAQVPIPMTRRVPNSISACNAVNYSYQRHCIFIASVSHLRSGLLVDTLTPGPQQAAPIQIEIPISYKMQQKIIISCVSDYIYCIMTSGTLYILHLNSLKAMNLYKSNIFFKIICLENLIAVDCI